MSRTSTSSLHNAYNVSEFRSQAHELIDMLADHLELMQSDRSRQVLPYKKPEESLRFWQQDLEQPGDSLEMFKAILDDSIYIHHPQYLGHQIAQPAFVSSLAGLMSDLLNNGTGVYEMGMSSNAIEKVVTDFVAQSIGYHTSASGFMTSGGSLANLTALLAARHAKAPNMVWHEGHDQKLAVMVSEETHYCIRAARIMGLGDEGIIKVPVDEQYKIRTDLLEEYLQKAIDNNTHVICVIGCAASTSTGSFDDLEAIADFANKNDIWFHVDGAHGGSATFSEQHKHLVKGIDRADSVVIDFHKMLMSPALSTALIFKDTHAAYKTFNQRAQYLWDEEQSEEWYNTGKRTFECTKFMMSIKVYSILKTLGKQVFQENVDALFNIGFRFADIVKERPNFELALDPECNIINYRYVNASVSDLNALNAAIRQQLVEDGKFYVVQTIIDGKRYLRTCTMNPFTTDEDVHALLDEIEHIGRRLVT